MLVVNVAITRFVDNAVPGFVECCLKDAWGREWLFIDKVPVVALADLDANGSYPQPGVIACQVIDRRQVSDGREIVAIDTELPWHVESKEGNTRFDVVPDQLTELAWPISPSPPLPAK